jgi:hypothetical protein
MTVRFTPPLLLFVWIGSVPAPVFAQGAIAGSVRDALGAPLTGVRVRAISPATIEKERVAVTDRAGRYRIEQLGPGTYRVDFTLPGWRPHQQWDVVLSGSFTASVDATLEPGPLSEEIVVTQKAPAVDLSRARREQVLGGDMVRSLPTVRSYNALLVLVPGLVTNGNDIVTGTTTASFPIHGGRVNEGRLMLDGLTIGSPPSGNSATSYDFNTGTAQEIVFTTSAGLGEAETAGLVMNIVPRSGGNALHGSAFASGTTARLQSNNLTAELIEQGVTATTPLDSAYDVAGSLGGPLRKDRVWYFVHAHRSASTRETTNVYYNLNAGDASRWLYAPDLSRRAYSDRVFENASGRLTWQATARHKVTGFWDAQALCRTCTGATPGLSEPARVSPEAVGVLGRPLHVWQAAWMAPLSHRWLVESGFGGTSFGVGNFERQPNPTRDLIRIVEQCASGCADNGGIPGLTYRSQDFSDADAASYLWKGSVSYVTGTHSLKVGYQHTLMTDDRTWMTNTQDLTYRVNNGVPNQLTQSISPWVNDGRAAWQALFAQHQWTRGRLSVQGGMRFDRAWSWFPAQRQGPSRFLPQPMVIPETRGIDSYKDVTVRMGAVYDVSGTGRTALKVSLGRYLEGVGVSGNYANTNPTLRVPRTTPVFGTAGVTRAWTDANRNFVPDCDLSNPAAQDLRERGGDLCGVLSDTRFGTSALTNSFDPALLNGWGVRPSDWHLGIALQQQVGSRSSLTVAYTRRSFAGFSVVDNRALAPADLTPFSIVAPEDPRLPGGGGYVVSGLYDVVPEKVGQVDNFVTDAAPHGRWSQHFTGIDVTIDIRAGQGLTVGGGTSTGQTVADNCDVRARLPELATTAPGTSTFGAGLLGSAVTPVSPYCRVAYGVLTQVRGFGTYVVPKVDVQLAATFQSKPGPMHAANYAVPSSAAEPSLGRPLSGNAANVTVNLVAPGTLYGSRINQVDLRVGKILTLGNLRTLLAVDVYNLLNSSAVLTYNGAFVPGGTWRQPLTILTPRFVKLTAEIEF